MKQTAHIERADSKRFLPETHARLQKGTEKTCALIDELAEGGDHEVRQTLTISA